jgi:hypothetical protein
VELAAGHGVKNLGPRAAMVGEEIGAALWVHLGLVLHVLAATGCEKCRCHTGHSSCAQEQAVFCVRARL